MTTTVRVELEVEVMSAEDACRYGPAWDGHPKGTATCRVLYDPLRELVVIDLGERIGCVGIDDAQVVEGEP